MRDLDLMKRSVMTPREREDFFQRKGYLVIPDALPAAAIAGLNAAVDRIAADGPKSGQITVNIADILGRDDAFLDLVDCPRVFPKIWGILGWNIWVQHSHLVVTPPLRDPAGAFNYGWHRDGGAINRDLAAGAHTAPLLVKVGFYLTDVTADGGPTLMLDTADPDARIPAATERPAAASALVVRAGTAVVFSNRSIHSLKSPNTSPHTRRAVFIQYGYRWIQPLDRSSHAHLGDVVDDVRRQLLGLTTTFTTATYKGSEGRSGRFVPAPEDVPLVGFLRELLGPAAHEHVARSLAPDELRAESY